MAGPFLLGKTLAVHRTEKDALSMVMTEIIYFLWVVVGTRNRGGWGKEWKGWLLPTDHYSVLGPRSVLCISWSWFIFSTSKNGGVVKLIVSSGSFG